MNNEFMSPLITDYLNPDDLVDLHQPHSSSSTDPFASSPMSPVPSTASTPPTNTTSAAALAAATNSGYTSAPLTTTQYLHMSGVLPASSSSSSSSAFAGPVSLSTAPHYGGGGGGGMPFPRRAEQMYAQNMHNYNYPFSGSAVTTPTMGIPPQPQLPRARSLQMPVAPLLQTHQQHQHQQQHQQQMMTPTSASTTMVPEISSSAPDGPSTGGGSRKRPKYTRSKKGCLTCRSKKIKCDERHPVCTRCEHGHRECTWPEAVLPRRPKGAVRGIGNEGDEELVDEEGRRQSIPGSAVSTHFPPPSSTTSSHFPGIPTNSPFEPAPRRDVYDSDGFPTGSQFSVPALPANTRPSFYPRPMGAAALPSGGEFYPVTAVNGQPIEDYEFPPRQVFGTGASSAAAAVATGARAPYPNGTLYPGGAVASSSNYAADLRRASWDSSIADATRRPSWDASGTAHASSVSSPASSVVGLGLVAGAAGPSGGNSGRTSGAGSVGSSAAGGTTASSSVSGGSGGGAGGSGGLMLFQSPDPLSPFFRSVQERNLVGNISSFAISSASSAPLLRLDPTLSFSLSAPSPYSAPSLYSQPSLVSTTLSSSSSDLSSPSTVVTLGMHNLSTLSPVLSTASSAEFGVDAAGIAYRRSSYPHLYPTNTTTTTTTSAADRQPLTIDPPVPLSLQGINLSTPSVDLFSLASASKPIASSEDVEWLAPPSADIYKPLVSPEEEEFISWSAYS